MALQPYKGEEKIIFGLDIGTTMTAVSYVHLVHGSTPKVIPVSRWPMQEEAAGTVKFPSVVLYDIAGKAVAFGAAALAAVAQTEGRSLVRWFKLLLHPRSMRVASGIEVEQLPRHITLKTVYTDFIAYVFAHAQEVFQRQFDGDHIWERLRSSFELVFAVPNGWSDVEQHFIRDAVLAARVLPPDFADNRLAFVSEAEASVHFAMDHMNLASKMVPGRVLGVIDAGGSTVDTTLYRCEALTPQIRLKELTASECVQAGSLFVDRAFEKYIRSALRDSDTFGKKEYIEYIVTTFERRTKRLFTGAEVADVGVEFAPSGTDKAHGIVKGRLGVPIDVMRMTFEKPIGAIVASVASILERGKVECKDVLLVGGFAESPYLQRALQESLQYRSIKFVPSDEQTAKAAALGACSWRVKRYVTARASRCTYGMSWHQIYDPRRFPVQRERADWVTQDAAGDDVLGGCFKSMVLKNQVVEADRPIRVDLRWDCASAEPKDLGEWSVQILASDEVEVGFWATTPAGALAPGLRHACTLTADLSGLRGALKRHVNPRTKMPYWRIEYAVEVYFGKTSLCASIVWKENGKAKKGPVTVIPHSIL